MITKIEEIKFFQDTPRELFAGKCFALSVSIITEDLKPVVSVFS